MITRDTTDTIRRVSDDPPPQDVDQLAAAVHQRGVELHLLARRNFTGYETTLATIFRVPTTKDGVFSVIALSKAIRAKADYFVDAPDLMRKKGKRKFAEETYGQAHWLDARIKQFDTGKKGGRQP